MRMRASIAYFVLVLVLVLVLPGAAASQQANGIGITGELRLRTETERPALVDTTDVFTLLRARLGLQAELGSNARVFLQVQDARVLGEEGSTLDASADRFDLHQGYLEWGRGLGGYTLGVRAGRQEISLGNERLVGAVAWSNTGRSFDALRVTLAPTGGSWNLTTFASTMRERGRRQNAPGEAGVRNDHTFLGAYADSKWVDAFLLFDANAAYRSFTGADRLTIGGHIDAPKVGGLTAWADLAYQAGSQLLADAVEQDIAAYLAGARVAYGMTTSPVKSVGVGVDYLSGDETPGDDEYKAFNTLYHTGHKWYGYLDLFPDPNTRTGDRGLVDAMLNGTVQLSAKAPLAIDLHHFATAAQRTDAEASDLGWELDLTLPVTWAPNRSLQLGYSAYRNGDAMPVIAGGQSGDWYHWAYAMLTFRFSGGTQ